MDHSLPLAVRKQLLLSRAALERLQLEAAVRDFSAARRRYAVLGEILAGGPGAPGGALVQRLLAGLALVRRYPYLGSIASIAFGATRATRVGRWIRRLGLVAALGAGGVWLAGRWSDARVNRAPIRADER